MTITKAADLVGESNFDALLEYWRTERHCPIALVDLLLEYGLDGAAEVARWCANEKDREQFTALNELVPSCGIYPKGVGSNDKERGYWCHEYNDLPLHANCVPISRDEQWSEEFPYVLIWLLDNEQVQWVCTERNSVKKREDSSNER